MDYDPQEQKRLESQKRIQEAFKLVRRGNTKYLRLSDILDDHGEVYFTEFERETVFGFNVRLNSDDAIIPLLGGEIWKSYSKKREDFGKDIDLDFTIPRIFESTDSRTIEFSMDSENKVEEGGDALSEEIIKKIESEKSFAVVPKVNLFPKVEKVYYWISRECEDFEKKGIQYLSNILIISSKKKHIDYVKRHHIDFVRFLFKMEMAYALILEKSRKVESIKSAVAAIMSRNMSHNLGSHYLYYTKNQLAALADGSEESGPDIRGAAKVLGYMQARMDYLATIVSGDKYPYGSVFFKGQIFDELTIDDFSMRHFHDELDQSTGKNKIYKRTTNYLLQNIVLSENFTRDSVLDGKESRIKDGFKKIRLQIKYNNEGTFTGDPSKEEEEQITKLNISKLCVALPGGVMSIHAFYNVVENLIRNSAKYHKGDFKEELVLTIRINELSADFQLGLPPRYEFVLFDNKANALKPFSSEDPHPLVERMNRELCQLKILTEKNELDKSNKGLKEMLFSIIWMRAYTNEKSKHMSDILADLDQLSGDKRMSGIRRHAYEYVAVDDEGDTSSDGTALNLGIRFELPKYCMMENVDASELKDNLIEKGLNNFTDILCVDPHYTEMDTLRGQFTRVHSGVVNNVDDSETAVSVFKGILRSRFPGFDDYQLMMDSQCESGFFGCDKRIHGIFFKTHEADLTEMEKYAYSEAISGENFTKTMLNLFVNGFDDFGKYSDSASEFFALKIKESALTRITLIDERLYNDMRTQENKERFLELKNIRILSLSDSDDEYTEIEDGTLNVQGLFVGSKFRDEKDATHFLSIHLGMIEKIVKDDSKWVKVFRMESKSTAERVELFMAMIKKAFCMKNGEVFISIHSGRGNFSQELDDSLQSYPFISVSALESTYANSKFLLSQLFYNTVYIGKGVTNAGE